jgi:RNA polymerase sigma-70 factor (ECF subfamily)
MLPTSPSLLERLRDRADNLAWRRLLKIYEPWLRGWLCRQQLQSADVEDALQDILTTVSVKLPNFVHNGHPGAFRAWLRAILVNRVRHILRGQRHREAREAIPRHGDWLDQLEDDNSTPSQQWNREHDQQLVRRMLARIQPEFHLKTWQVFQMLVLEDRPAAEVAQHFNIAVNLVYIAKSRVLSRLRMELRGLMDG